jgi:hypothetical protein
LGNNPELLWPGSQQESTTDSLCIAHAGWKLDPDRRANCPFQFCARRGEGCDLYEFPITRLADAQASLATHSVAAGFFPHANQY